MDEKKPLYVVENYDKSLEGDDSYTFDEVDGMETDEKQVIFWGDDVQDDEKNYIHVEVHFEVQDDVEEAIVHGTETDLSEIDVGQIDAKVGKKGLDLSGAKLIVRVDFDNSFEENLPEVQFEIHEFEVQVAEFEVQQGKLNVQACETKM